MISLFSLYFSLFILSYVKYYNKLIIINQYKSLLYHNGFK